LPIRDRNGGATAVLRQLVVSADAADDEEAQVILVVG
jgi:hypothetical protein